MSSADGSSSLLSPMSLNNANFSTPVMVTEVECKCFGVGVQVIKPLIVTSRESDSMATKLF
jgi:hypothetical protein